MPFPFVAVTLPDDTPPAYVAGLLSACSQAYPEGGCRSDVEASSPNAHRGGATTTDATSNDAARSPAGAQGSAPSSLILANVTWANPETATVLLGLPHWRNHRWLERSVPFKEHDQPLERYRALGFTIGSLAVTVSEVAKLEREARELETKPPAPAEPSTSAKPPTVAKPAEPVSPPPAAPAAANDPPDAVDIPILAEDSESSHLFVRGYVAGELGEGLDALRRGGSMGLGLFARRWGARASGYYTDASGNGLDATFAGLELTADFRITWSVLEANICVGGGVGHLNAHVDNETSEVFPSGLLVVNLMPVRWPLGPYLGVGARLIRGFETDVPGIEPLGPITPFLQLGLILSAEGPGDASR